MLAQCIRSIVAARVVHSGNATSVIGSVETQDLQTGDARSVVCIVETQDLESGNTRSVICNVTRSAIWKHKICSLETQDLYPGSKNIPIPVFSPGEDLMDHASLEWLTGVHLISTQTNH